MPEVSMWAWYRDYLEDLAINNDGEDNPYIQEFQDYRAKTGDEDFDNYSVGVGNYR